MNPLLPSNDRFEGFETNSSVNLTTSPFTTTPSVAITVSPINVSESGNVNLVYNITRTGDTTSSLNVRFTVRGTARFNQDYTQTGANFFSSLQGSLNLASGVTSATIILDPIADNQVEFDETAILTLINGTGYTVGNPSSATGTILNDTVAPSISVVVSPGSVQENGAPNLVYTFSRTGNNTNGLSGVLFSVSGDAGFNQDYTVSGANQFSNTSGSVNFAPNSSTATVTINPTADNQVEFDETAILTLTNGTGYTVGNPNSATGTILNDDVVVVPSISVAVSPSSV
ncbi:hypothetical protein GLO73106DRAFT_00021960, partial [Gloeocapsa sp. PCC 73106]